MFDNEMNDCQSKPHHVTLHASLQISMNAAMEAICVMWMRTVRTLMALTTAPAGKDTLGMENRAKVDVVTFISILEYFVTQVFLLVFFKFEIKIWCARKSRGLDFGVKVFGFQCCFIYWKKNQFQENISAGNILNFINFNYIKYIKHIQVSAGSSTNWLITAQEYTSVTRATAIVRNDRSRIKYQE